MSHYTFDPLQGVLVNPDGTPTVAFTVYWQKFRESLTEALSDLESINTQQTDIINDLTDQLALIQAAQATADAVRRTDAISGSKTSPSAILSAADAGANATITVANHTRLWGDATSLAVTGGAVAGLVYSTVYAVYYDDITRAVTAPTYSATTDLKAAQHNFAPGRIFCGNITTPAAAAPPTTGSTGGSGGSFDPNYEIP